MSKKINWYAGKNPNNPADMQEICDEVANATDVQNLAEKIKGSESVIVDVAEDEQSLEIHLDAEVTSDISRSLKTPVSAPTDTSIVAVDSANAQTMLKIGDGLSVENGELSASGSGSGKMYLHCVNINGMIDNYYYELYTAVTTSDSAPISSFAYFLDKQSAGTILHLSSTGTISSIVSATDYFFAVSIFVTKVTETAVVYATKGHGFNDFDITDANLADIVIEV